MQTKSILRNSLIALALISAMCIAGCTDHNNSGKNYPILPFHDFTAELQASSAGGSFSASDFRAMRSKHGRFFDIWFHEIMGFPQTGNDSLSAVLLQNLTSTNRPVFRAIQAHYKKYPDVIQKVSNAFGRL